jgi:hypothetical protein
MPMKPVSSCFLDMFNYFHGYSNRQEDLHTYTVPSRPMNPLTPPNNVITRAMLKQVVIQFMKDGIFRFISCVFARGTKPLPHLLHRHKRLRYQSAGLCQQECNCTREE